MEDNRIKNLFTDAKKIALTPEEKSIIKHNLISHMRLHPAAESCHCHCHEDKTCHKGGIFCLNKRFLMFASLVVLVTTGASVSMAAQTAFPGDRLYGVKVGFNEEIKSYVTFSEEDNARWQIRRLERRAQEAEKLASEMTVSNTAKSVIEAQFELQSQRVGHKIAELQKEGNYNLAAQISSEFESSMRAHQNVFAALNDTNVDYQFRVKPLEVKVSSILDIATELKKQSLSKITSDIQSTGMESSAQVQLQSAENLLTEVGVLMDHSSNSQVKTRAGVEIEAATSLITNGKVSLKNEAFHEASSAFEEATWKLREAKIILESSSHLYLESEVDTILPSATPSVKNNPLEVKIIPETRVTQISEVHVQPSISPQASVSPLLNGVHDILGQ